MNRFAYLTTGLAIKAISNLSKATVRVHIDYPLPEGAIIFAVNHFTRIETLLLPTYLNELTKGRPVFSLADASLFTGGLKGYLEQVGAISTRRPDRDHMIVKTLLNGSGVWIIFPEGCMVKNKKIMDGGHFIVTAEDGKHPPHTGTAALALQTELFRRHLRWLKDHDPERCAAFAGRFEITDTDRTIDATTHIVPVNLTYYPLRARENLISKAAAILNEDIPERAMEEIMTEGSMLFSGVDIDIRFGPPIPIGPYISHLDQLTDRIQDPTPCVEVTGSCRKHLARTARKIMIRYMTEIYRMTTVNHDHLFASLIRRMPRQHIDPDDLRRRVFLLTGQMTPEWRIHRHQSMENDQIHLITDDRFGKFRDFIAIALEKSLLVPDRKGYQKNQSVFTAETDFHRVRVSNPLSVIANEVEPLTRLQRAVQWMAWLPRFYVRRRIVEMLAGQAAAEFQSDHARFFVPDAALPPEIGAPFLVPSGRQVGVLLIHGYMAAPRQCRLIADYLGRMGISVYVPRLRGHGTTAQDLSTRSLDDWRQSVDRGFALIRNRCRQVVVGGFSTGAGLAMDLVSRVPDVKGLFAVCPPRRLQDPSLKGNIAKDIWKRLVDRIRGTEDKAVEFLENRPETPDFCYKKNPVSGIQSIERLMEYLETQFETITQPFLFLHSYRDPVASAAESRRIFEAIGSRDKTYVLFDFNRHDILSGPGSDRVHGIIGSFVRRVTTGQSTI